MHPEYVPSTEPPNTGSRQTEPTMQSDINHLQPDSPVQSGDDFLLNDIPEVPVPMETSQLMTTDQTFTTHEAPQLSSECEFPQTSIVPCLSASSIPVPTLVRLNPTATVIPPQPVASPTPLDTQVSTIQQNQAEGDSPFHVHYRPLSVATTTSAQVPQSPPEGSIILQPAVHFRPLETAHQPVCKEFYECSHNLRVFNVHNIPVIENLQKMGFTRFTYMPFASWHPQCWTNIRFRSSGNQFLKK